MLRPLDAPAFLDAAVPIVDVRSPSEYHRGHIPGARMLPLFTDTEHAVVGTLYKQQGRNAAALEGFRFVGPRLAWLVEEAQRLAPAGRINVHCWRGGERSSSVAWLLHKAGFTEVNVLQGGYKGFRAYVLQELSVPWNIRVLGGCTGCGKTEVLHALADAGQPVIDLEALAAHKGSSFGLLGSTGQPTTEHFENLLWAERHRADPIRPIWVEDENRTIGHVSLPSALFEAMRTAPVHHIQVPVDLRIARLVRDYGHHPKEQLAEALARIRKRMGPQNHKAALAALEVGDLHAVVRITLDYYDRAYRHSLESRAANTMTHIIATDTADATRTLLDLAN